MLTVDDYELSRRMHLVEGLSQREVAQRRRHSRKTVARALKLKIPPCYRLGKPRPCPVIEPVQHIIDCRLEENKKIRSKSV